MTTTDMRDALAGQVRGALMAAGYAEYDHTKPSKAARFALIPLPSDGSRLAVVTDSPPEDRSLILTYMFGVLVRPGLPAQLDDNSINVSLIEGGQSLPPSSPHARLAGLRIPVMRIPAAPQLGLTDA